MTAKTIRSWAVHIKIGMNGNGERRVVEAEVSKLGLGGLLIVSCSFKVEVTG